MSTQILHQGPIFHPEPFYHSPNPNPRPNPSPRPRPRHNPNPNRHLQRQFFLRSYQFSRKQTFGERVKRSFVKFKQSLWARVRAAKRVRRFVWAGLRFAMYNKRRKIEKILSYHFGGGLSCEKFYKYELFYASPYHAPSCLW